MLVQFLSFVGRAAERQRCVLRSSKKADEQKKEDNKNEREKEKRKKGERTRKCCAMNSRLETRRV